MRRRFARLALTAALCALLFSGFGLSTAHAAAAFPKRPTSPYTECSKTHANVVASNTWNDGTGEKLYVLLLAQVDYYNNSLYCGYMKTQAEVYYKTSGTSYIKGYMVDDTGRLIYASMVTVPASSTWQTSQALDTGWWAVNCAGARGDWYYPNVWDTGYVRAPADGSLYCP